eukprot:m.327826 g.327826  ORF g.327826 m.327826 type:complete len:88 (-) comp16026_c2_seq13:2967-3230(-)
MSWSKTNTRNSNLAEPSCSGTKDDYVEVPPPPLQPKADSRHQPKFNCNWLCALSFHRIPHHAYPRLPSTYHERRPVGYQQCTPRHTP